MGPAQDPSGVSKAWLPGLCSERCKVYAPSVGRETISGLAQVPQATRLGDMGLRLPLRPDDLLQDAVCVLCYRSRQPGSAPRPVDAASDCRVDSAPDPGMLRLRPRGSCLDHIIVLGEAHLRRILKAYASYYNNARTHLSLKKDAPSPRSIERVGRITSIPILGGLHHQYCRT